MLRVFIVLSALYILAIYAEGQTQAAIVADSASRVPLPNASVFDRHGKLIGICNSAGRLPYTSPSDYPVTVRYLGFYEKTIPTVCSDTIFMEENFTELPEVIIESRRHKVLHLLAYIREFSTLTTYSDTVFLFREKMADYMLPSDRKMKYRGWSIPRILKSKSYYRFTDSYGLDSVSDCCNQHFSWADWVGIVPAANIPPLLRIVDSGADTIRGRYGKSELWRKDSSRISVDVDLLADTSGRKWAPALASFFHNDIDFERFSLRFNYDNVADSTLLPGNLTGYSFNIESNGRGHGMFMFNREDEPFCVSTYAEVYVVDKEYITTKEASRWEKRKFDTDKIVMYEPADAPELQPEVLRLIERVSTVNPDNIRLAMIPDKRLAGRRVEKLNIGQKAFKWLKGRLGIDNIIAPKKWDKRWKEFRDSRKR